MLASFAHCISVPSPAYTSESLVVKKYPRPHCSKKKTYKVDVSEALSMSTIVTSAIPFCVTKTHGTITITTCVVVLRISHGYKNMGIIHSCNYLANLSLQARAHSLDVISIILHSAMHRSKACSAVILSTLSCRIEWAHSSTLSAPPNHPSTFLCCVFRHRHYAFPLSTCATYITLLLEGFSFIPPTTTLTALTFELSKNENMKL